MGRLFWSLAFVLAFLLGLSAAGMLLTSPSTGSEVDRLKEMVTRLEQQVATLQARLRARESVPGPRPSSSTAHADMPPFSSRATTEPADRIALGAVMQDATSPDRDARRGTAAQPSSRSSPDGASRGDQAKAGPPPTVDAALDRFYKYLEATNGMEWRERGPQVRSLIDDLRSMGDVGAQALMNVLAAGTDSDQRRAAARLLGTLQVPQALPLLRDIIEKEDDLLLRRAAAAGLRRLQTPDSLPVMERILTNPGEDRFVRLSAALGLAESGRHMGVTGLTVIFDESAADGRGRDLAFRALVSLNDERSLPFMRQLVTSPVEPGYRLQAMRYLAAQGRPQGRRALHVIMQSPTEQPSVRDAAAQAHAAISSK